MFFGIARVVIRMGESGERERPAVPERESRSGDCVMCSREQGDSISVSPRSDEATEAYKDRARRVYAEKFGPAKLLDSANRAVW